MTLRGALGVPFSQSLVRVRGWFWTLRLAAVARYRIVGLGRYVWRRVRLTPPLLNVRCRFRKLRRRWFAVVVGFGRYRESQKALGFLRLPTWLRRMAFDLLENYMANRERRRRAGRRSNDPPRDLGHLALAAVPSYPIVGSR